MSAIARADGLRPRPEVAVRRTADEPGKEGLEGGVSIARDAIPRTLSRLSSVAPLRKTATAGYAPQVRNATKCARAQDPARPRSTGRSVDRSIGRSVDRLSAEARGWSTSRRPSAVQDLATVTELKHSPPRVRPDLAITIIGKFAAED